MKNGLVLEKRDFRIKIRDKKQKNKKPGPFPEEKYDKNGKAASRMISEIAEKQNSLGNK